MPSPAPPPTAGGWGAEGRRPAGPRPGGARRGAPPPPGGVEGGGGLPGARARAGAAALGGPTIATACLATGAGFLVLLLSPVPMVRGFGLLLVVGIALAFVLALTAGFAALSLVP